MPTTRCSASLRGKHPERTTEGIDRQEVSKIARASYDTASGERMVDGSRPAICRNSGRERVAKGTRGLGPGRRGGGGGGHARTDKPARGKAAAGRGRKTPDPEAKVAKRASTSGAGTGRSEKSTPRAAKGRTVTP